MRVCPKYEGMRARCMGPKPVSGSGGKSFRAAKAVEIRRLFPDIAFHTPLLRPESGSFEVGRRILSPRTGQLRENESEVRKNESPKGNTDRLSVRRVLCVNVSCECSVTLLFNGNVLPTGILGQAGIWVTTTREGADLSMTRESYSRPEGACRSQGTTLYNGFCLFQNHVSKGRGFYFCQ